MTPNFTLRANDTDITAKIKDRLIRITSTDEAGFKSDTLAVKLDNRDYEIAVPPKGATLELALGYGDALTKIGQFIVDEPASAGPVSTLTIKAKAADMLGAFAKERKTRSWGEETLSEIVTEIAGEYGLTPRVADSLSAVVVAPIPYAQIDQTNETDSHFLTRLAKKYDAVSKPVFGHLIFVPKGEAKSASGQAIPAVTLTEADVTSWSARAPERGKYKSAKAYWINPQTQEREFVIAGDGAPIFSLRHGYASAEEAEAAAASKLAALARAASTLSLSLPGNAALAAEGRVTFETRDTLAAGDWIVTRVEHELSGGSGGGFHTRLDLETPKETSK